ncbi:MAG: hypothetical protein ACKVII_23995 [Planctomycetales bacterium]|jgi:hypothetical protein
MDVDAKANFTDLTGRCFAHPVFDYLLIGGGLSLIVIPAVYGLSDRSTMLDSSILPWFVLFSNSAHFAASTVRLYTKPGTKDSLPFLTLAFPAVALGVLTLCMFASDWISRYVQLIYLTWSPYHYAAQAYGLSVMYCVRSGCNLTKRQKQALWWIAILPFFKVLIIALSKHAVAWTVPDYILWSHLDWRSWIEWVSMILGGLALVLPILLFGQVWRTTDRSMPLISLLVILTNALWFVIFPLIDGFVWTTIFHGIQYLAIVMIFHVRDRLALPGNKRSAASHAVWFYGASILLGYAMFNCLPYGYQMLGFGAAKSVLLVIAAINIHHFIVDGYIWKLGRGDVNRRVVEGDAVAAGQG